MKGLFGFVSLAYRSLENGQIVAVKRFDAKIREKQAVNFDNTSDHFGANDEELRDIGKPLEEYEEFSWMDDASKEEKHEVRRRFGEFVGDAWLVGHAVTPVFMETVRAMGGKEPAVMDTEVLARVFFPRLRQYSLPTLGESLGLHEKRFMEDLWQNLEKTAEAVGGIFLLCQSKALSFDAAYYLRVESVVSRTIYHDFFNSLKKAVLSGPGRHEMTGLFALKGNETVSDHVDTNRAASNVPRDFRWAASCFASDGLLASALNGFESREAQVTMAQSIVDVLDEGSHLVIEAETGTGKSLAYMLPALWWARLREQKVVVATHTIPLQEQLFKKDLPMLADVLPFSFQTALLKGRNNYLCPLLLEQELPLTSGLVMMPERAEGELREADETGDAGDAAMVWPMLFSWLRETATGDVSELPQTAQLSEVWPRLNAEYANCMIRRCPHARQCFMLKARQRAQDADVIVVNHSLFLADLRAEVLPEYHYLVVDEAHNLYAGALQHLGFELSLERMFRMLARWHRSGRGSAYAGWRDLLRKMSDLEYGKGYQEFAEHLEECPSLAARIREQAEQTFSLLSQLMGDHLSLRLTLETLPSSVYALFMTEMENLSGRLEELEKTMQSMIHSIEAVSQLDDLRYEIMGEQAQLREWSAGLRQAADLSNELRITYLEKSSGLWLKNAPLDIAAILKEILFGEKRTVVLCSATLSVAGDFGYFMREVGLDDGKTETLMLKSQFDYESQMLSCIVSSFPRGTGFVYGEDEGALAREVASFVAEAALAAQGRTLVLFTSHRLLRLVNSALEDMREDKGGDGQAGYSGLGALGILAQGVHGGRDALLDDFRAHRERVLLGSSSFWEGIDLPGEELSCLIMVRLPFWPPSMPVIEARSELMVRRGRNPFRELLLPEAVIRFKQGFGRLLRTREDRGVFILLDDRVVSKRYGMSFLKSLSKRTHARGSREQVLQRVRGFFEDAGGADASWQD